MQFQPFQYRAQGTPGKPTFDHARFDLKGNLIFAIHRMEMRWA